MYSSDKLCDLGVLLKNTFKFRKNIFKQKSRTAIGTKFAPPYSILSMAELVEESILRKAGFKSHLWQGYIDDIFLL